MAQDKLYLFDPHTQQPVEVKVKRPVTALVTDFRQIEARRNNERDELQKKYAKALELSYRMVQGTEHSEPLSAQDFMQEQSNITKYNYELAAIEEKFDLEQAKLVLDANNDEEFWNAQIAKEVYTVVEFFRSWTQRGI